MAERDAERAQHLDVEGRPTSFATLLQLADPAIQRELTPQRMAERQAETQAAIARLGSTLASARLDALIVIGDDQEEMFDHSNMPAIGVYYGETIANAQASPATAPLDRARMRILEPNGNVDYPCHAPLARHLIASLQHDGFDL